MRIFRTTIWAIALWCATASMAAAVNIHDVIELSRQGYSDEEIVAIVRTTGSVFKLTAPDIPLLKELGVSEPVIRVMLESGLGDLAAEKLLPDAAAGRESSAVTPAAAAAVAPLRAGTLAATADRFSLQPVAADATGATRHMFVTVLGAPVLTLSDEGRFPSLQDRGTAVVRNLEEAVRLGDGGFRLLRTDDAVQVVYHSANLREVPIITLDRPDIYAYDARSERQVTPEVLAMYWAALLNDYWAISVQHRRPSRLVNLQHGAALRRLFDIVHAADPGRQEPAEVAYDQLPVEIRGQLERLATAVPDDFRPFPG